MTVNRIFLEWKIAKLNQWLIDRHPDHNMYKLKTANRNYYVSKLIELEENNLETIKI